MGRPLLVSLLDEAHDFVGSVRFEVRVFPVEVHCLVVAVCRLSHKLVMEKNRSIISDAACRRLQCSTSEI